MKILFVSTPLTGHLNPLLGIARMLIADGHEVVCLSGRNLQGRIEGVGAEFRSFSTVADLNLGNAGSVAAELQAIPPGPEWLRVAIERRFIDTIPAQDKDIKQVLRDFPADVVIGDNMMFGLLPMLLGPRSNRPSVVLCGTSFLHWHREDGAPHFIGLPPAAGQTQLREYAAITQEYDRVFHQPIARRLKEVGAGPLPTTLFDSAVLLPDAFLELTVPGFEFPRPMPPSVHFVGGLPIIPGQAPLPSWANDLDGSRKVVLVTQGTVANHDFSLLVGPTLAALANEPDLLVLVTAGGRSIDAIPSPIPGNARVASYLPFEWVLPKVDVFVTNGGYGSVNQALSFGIPLVTAGLTEDKADVNARIAWSGVGMDLATNAPTSQALYEAVRAVLDNPGYRSRALAMADELGGIDTRSEILRIVNEVARRNSGGGIQRRVGRADPAAPVVQRGNHPASRKVGRK